jgi:hypothetical protein
MNRPRSFLSGNRPRSFLSGSLGQINFGRGIGSLALVVLVAALVALLVQVEGSAPPVPFSNPPIIESANGILSATLTVAPTEVIVASHVVKTTVYNGLYMPPVLKVNPGETIRLRLINGHKSPAPTNVHYHGLGVSPKRVTVTTYLSKSIRGIRLSTTISRFPMIILRACSGTIPTFIPE